MAVLVDEPSTGDLATCRSPTHPADQLTTNHHPLLKHGLAATALVLVAARRRWLSVLPVMVAAAGAAWLLGGPHPQWEPDPVATELVCTEDQPRVCLIRQDAFLLDDVTPIAREALARFEGVPGGPTRALGWTYGPPPGPEPHLTIDTHGVTLTGELDSAEWSAVYWWPELACGTPGDDHEYLWLANTASIWASGSLPVWATPEVADGYAALAAMPPAQQRAWIGELIAAAAACDRAVLDQLAERLG